jgi:phospholipase/carboxylesterase
VSAPDLTFTHTFTPGADSFRGEGGPAPESTRTLLLLHGTGGNEHDLVPLGNALAPGANLLSPRGQVLENGMPRFFRRVAEGVFDEADLRRRALDLADFVADAAQHYRFDPARVTAVGYSNGANIASAVLLLRPGTLCGAVLFRAMVPLVPDPLASTDARVLISNGRADPIVTLAETERLASLLRAAGARVDVLLQPAGHELTHGDLTAAQAWLRGESVLSS